MGEFVKVCPPIRSQLKIALTNGKQDGEDRLTVPSQVEPPCFWVRVGVEAIVVAHSGGAEQGVFQRGQLQQRGSIKRGGEGGGGERGRGVGGLGVALSLGLYHESPEGRELRSHKQRILGQRERAALARPRFASVDAEDERVRIGAGQGLGGEAETAARIEQQRPLTRRVNLIE